MASSRPRILVLAHRVPYPPNRGDRIRTFNILQFLARRADVSLAYLSDEQPSVQAEQALRGMCRDVVGLSLGKRRRWVSAARSLACGRTATEGLFWCGRLRHLLARWSKTTRFDAAVVFCSSMVQYLKAPGLDGMPTIVDLIDVDSQKWFDYAAQTSGLPRWLLGLEGRRLRRLERSLPAKARSIILVSRCETDLFRSFCATDSAYAIPNGVDLDYFSPGKGLSSGSTSGCVFVGALDYRANVDGIRWFCEEIWPEVQRRRPQATLTIVGSRPCPAVRRLASQPGVRLACDVADVRPYLADAAMVVVPLRVARGIQNKVLEALAMAKALIATPQALEGIDVEPGVHVHRATEPVQWIESVLRLLDDRSARERLGRAGRAFVEAGYRWERQLQPLAALLGLENAAHCDGHGTAVKQDTLGPLVSSRG
jgi:polysaccharide biosynthesis protein PslH